MKQTIAFLFAFAMLIPAFPAAAQTVDTTTTTQYQSSSQYRALLIQLIGLIEQEIAALQAQGITTGVVASQQGTIQATSTPPMEQELSCSLSFGNEATAKVVNPIDGTSYTKTTGQFQLSWDFTDGATGVLSSDNNDGGTLNASSGTRPVYTKGTVNYTLTVSKDGYQDAVCNASTTPAQ